MRLKSVVSMDDNKDKGVHFRNSFSASRAHTILREQLFAFKDEIEDPKLKAIVEKIGTIYWADVSLNDLFDLAECLDVALEIQFAPYGKEYVERTRNLPNYVTNPKEHLK